MGTSANENIAINVEGRANVAQLTQARTEVTELGAATVKSMQGAAEATTKHTLSIEQLREAQKIAAESGRETIDVLREIAAAEVAAETATKETTAAIVQQNVAVKETESSFATLGGFRGRSAIVGTIFALDAFTRSIDAGEGAMRRVLRSLSLVAFAFGPEIGIPVAGALALGDAIVESMHRSEVATEKARVSFEKMLETVSKGGLRQLSEAQQMLFSGDPFARRGAVPGETEAAWKARSEGLIGVERAIALVDEQAARLTVTWFNQEVRLHGLALAQNEMRQRTDELRASRSALVEQETRLNREIAEIAPLTARAMVVEGQHAQFVRDQLRERQAMRSVGGMPNETGRLPSASELLGTLSDIGAASMGTLQLLRGQELSIQLELGRTNLDYKERLDLLKQLASLQKEIGVSERVPTRDIRVGAATPIRSPLSAEQVEDILKGQRLGEQVQRQLAGSLGSGIAAGISAGFADGKVKSAFAAGGKALLSGFGGILMDLGQVYLEYSGIMEALTPLLGNPFTAGLAGAGIGAALIGLGAALQGVASRSSSGNSSAASLGSTFAPSSLAGAGGNTTVIINTVDPSSRGVTNSIIYEINRGGILNTPVVAPYGRPS